MERRTWQATVHGLAKTQTRLSDLACMYTIDYRSFVISFDIGKFRWSYVFRKVVWAIQSLLYFHTNFKTIHCISIKKMRMVFDSDCFESVDCLE